MGVSMILYTSQWYKPREQGTRAGVWNSMTAFANIIGGSVAYALSEGQAQGKYAIHGWKIVFITFGVCTAFIGLLFLFFVPDSPQNAWFLSPEDRVLATKRVGNNHQMISRAGWKWYQVREALTDKFVSVSLSLVSVQPSV